MGFLLFFSLLVLYLLIVSINREEVEQVQTSWQRYVKTMSELEKKALGEGKVNSLVRWSNLTTPLKYNPDFHVAVEVRCLFTAIQRKGDYDLPFSDSKSHIKNTLMWRLITPKDTLHENAKKVLNEEFKLNYINRLHGKT